MPRPPPPSPVPPPADHPCSIHGHDCKVPPDPLPAGAAGAFTGHRHLASGAFGRVYSTHSSRSCQAPDTALKVISKCTLGTSSAARAALRAEVDIQQTLRHPHIVALRDVLQDAKHVYLVLDYVAGPSLADLIAERGALPEPTARTYFAYLCRALAYSHARPSPVLHRDIKPANILLEADLSSVVLCDFGLAQRLPPSKPGRPPAPASLNLVGTPNFLAPELVDAASATGAASKNTLIHPAPLAVDAYAAGVVLYMMLTGTAPFDAHDVPRTFRRIRAGRLVFPPSVKISSHARALVKALLTRNPCSRPTIAAALTSPFLNPVPRTPSSRPLVAAGAAGFGKPPTADEIDRMLDQGTIGSSSESITPNCSGGGHRLAEAPGARARSKTAAMVQRGTVISQNQGQIQKRNFSESQHAFESPQQQRRLLSDGHKRVPAHVQELQLPGELEGEDLIGGADASMNPGAVPHPRGIGAPKYARQESMPATMAPPKAYSRQFSMGTERPARQQQRHRLLDEQQRDRKASNLDQRDSAQGNQDKRRPLSVSMTRSIMLYNQMLHGMNEGLNDAQKQLREDASNGVSESQAARRFQRVARRVDPGDSNLPIMVSRWLDMSNSHGFATKMEDGRIGCCFNDASIMFKWSSKRDVPDIAYASAAERGLPVRRKTGERRTSNAMAPRAQSSCATPGAGRPPGHFAPSKAADGRYEKMSEEPRIGTPVARRHDSLGTAHSTRATFRASRTFRSEMTEKAKLLCGFQDMFDDADDDDSKSEDGEEDSKGRGDSNLENTGENRDASSTISVDDEGYREAQPPATQERRSAVNGASSCSISFLGEDEAERDPRCTESLLKVRGLNDSNLIHVRGWQRYKSPRAVAFRLSNDSVHIKIELARPGEHGRYEEDFVMDARRQIFFYRGLDGGHGWECDIKDLGAFCFSKRFHSRVSFCSRVLARFVMRT